MVVPPKSSLFHWRFLTGDKPLLTLDDEFVRNHTKVLLTSDASEKIWKVKLVGNRLSGGWEEFAAVHKFSDGDVLAFRHNGDETFHVAVSNESDDDTEESESDESDDVEDEDNDDTEESESVDSDDVEDEDVDDDDNDNDEGNILVEKKKKPEADTSSGDSCFLRVSVTPSSLIEDRLYLSTNFKFMSFDELKKPCEIYLANEKGRKWTLILSRNISSGTFNIRRGWANFCSANGLSQGDTCNFKLSESGKRPVLLLCSQESDNGHEDKEEEEEEEEEKCPEADAVKICSVGGCSKEKNTPSRLLTLEFTPNRFKTGQLTISSVFLRESGINESMDITLLNKDGRKWSSYLQMSGQRGREMFYMRKGWKEMCKANEVEVNDSFALELICEDANPIFKFHSKIENKGKGSTRVSNRSHSNLKRKQPESCSVSDQVANVKQSIQDTLNTIRHFRAELKTREKNLEASLLEVDDLGERILGISKILNNNQV